MNLHDKIITVFGGTGFIGRQIVRDLAARGARIKVATRVPESAFFLKPLGNIGQITPILCDYFDEESIRAVVQGSDAVINCVGILFEKKHSRFAYTHGDLPGVIGDAARKLKVPRVIHISALGIEKSNSRYAASKRDGEKNLHAAFPKATILRPSVVFGTDDNFFNMFAGLAQIMPALPLIGGGYTRFQPVYVGDVANAVIAALDTPESAGKTYELGGPDILTFRQIYETLFRETGRRRCLVTLPWGLAKIKAGFMELMPTPPFTRDQVEQLKVDCVVGEKAKTLADLGLTATPLSLVLPHYLSRFKPGGRFGKQHRA